MTDQHDNVRFDQLRREEEERRRDLAGLRGTPADAAPDAPADGPEPGHLGNDMSKMTLLETDLEALAKAEDHEAMPEVREALDDLREIPVRRYVEEADRG